MDVLASEMLLRNISHGVSAMIKGTEDIHAAKHFLLQRVLEQAMREAVPFSSDEQQMVLFAEDTITEEEMRLAVLCPLSGSSIPFCP